MSLRYKGAVLSATPPTVNADGFGSAKGIWTMQQQYQYEGFVTWPSPFTPEYVEDVFSTYLYTGTGSTAQTINNGILLGNSSVENVSLHLTGDSLIDSSTSPSTLTVEGNTQVSTSVKKYGTGSIYFDGSGDRIVVPTATKLDLDGDFTIEMWVYPSIISSYQILFDTSSNGTAGSNMTEAWINASGYVEYYARGSILLTGTTALSANTWYHIAITKQGSTQRLFVNGIIEATTTNSTQPNISYDWHIADRKASAGSGQYPLQGYIDDLRITKGTARYTSNFTPPSAALPLDTLIEGKGGMVWIKSRSNAYAGPIFDTARGVKYGIVPSSSAAQLSITGGNVDLYSFNSNGFSVGSDNNFNINTNSATFASWTFRKAKKFFDVVTYTGNGVNGRNIAHNLGSTPGCMIIKCTSQAYDWMVYHRSAGSPAYDYRLRLNATAAAASSSSSYWGGADPTSTQFTLGNNAYVNESGQTYVAYLFAHDAGGFGDDGDQNIISCGSFTTNSSGNATVSLGYEPQWVMVKSSTVASGWYMFDTMRGLPVSSTSSLLFAQSTNAEVQDASANVNNTGFLTTGLSGSQTYIYIAIRRGPMKTPTDATKVFTSAYGTGSSNPAWISGFPVDFSIDANIGGGSTDEKNVGTRLLDRTYLVTNTTAAESSWSAQRFDYQNGFRTTNNGSTDFAWMFRRAPKFFDVVCYTGNGSTQSVNHNLGVSPELIIVKWRNGGATEYGWRVYHKDEGITKWGQFTTDAFSTASAPYPWDTPTSTVFKLGNGSTWFSINGSSRNFVAYLFASCPGVSKVGSYTGTGTASVNQINCGFTNGARFVLIKRTDSTGGWHVWDSTRGIISGNDPYALLNDSSGQTTNTDWIDPYTSGFELSTASGNSVNTSGATYIYLAIA